VAEVLKQLKRTTSFSRLDAREVVAVADTLEQPKITTSDSRLNAREVSLVVVAEGLKQPEKTTSGSRLKARKVVSGGGRAVRVVVVGFESPSLGWILPRWSPACRHRHRCCGLSSLLWVVVAAVGCRRCCGLSSLLWVVITAVGCHRCCGSSLLHCDYASSLWCCWRFSSALRSLHRRRV